MRHNFSKNDSSLRCSIFVISPLEPWIPFPNSYATVYGCRQVLKSGAERQCSSPFAYRSLVDAFSVFVGALLARLDYEMQQTYCANAVIALLPLPVLTLATKSPFLRGIMLHGAFNVGFFRDVSINLSRNLI